MWKTTQYANWGVLLIVWLGAMARQAEGQITEPPAGSEAAAFFETRIRPLLAAHCYECHGRSEQESGLRLDSLAAMLAGGEAYGPAIVRGNPGESVLIDAVQYGELNMPPDRRLAEHQVADLVRWIKMGAPWPGADTADAPDAPFRHATQEVTDEDRQHWAYQPVRCPPVPRVRGEGQVRNPIDAFVLARLEPRGLTLSGRADRRELIRRAYFDLIGLPPDPEQVEAFLDDDRPQAYRDLIERLLAMPEYGERWGRHWLDIVRFAQTNGYERDSEKPQAWRYRDYVIRALNQDKPYDQFIKEQVAGDELDQATDDSVTATAIYRLGVWDDEPDDRRQAEFDELDDMLSTICTATLGVTIGCARCHAHKFDPVPHEDYYRMLAFLRNVTPYENPKPGSPVYATLPSGGTTLGVTERSAEAATTHVLIRGSAGSPGEEVQPRFLQVLCPDQAAEVPEPFRPRRDTPSAGRRRVLADWIASAENPLTARVLVNRLWQHHFGRGIVATPSDFGRAGMPPTHPRLLDWLAAELVKGNWRLKRMHQLIMNSAVYRQSSRIQDPRAAEVDPDNTLLWRQHLRRLDAEAIHDSILAVAGTLNGERGGRGFFPRLGQEVLAGQSKPGWGWDVSPPDQRRRRSVYAFIKRSLREPLIEAFDYGNTTSPLEVRPTTTVAPQALLLLNSQFMQHQAHALAKRVVREAGEEQKDQVRRMYELALARKPSDRELATSLDYLVDQHQALARIRSQLVFRPDVPTSVQHEYRMKLSAKDYVVGPRQSWRYHPGVWGGGYEGLDVADPERGPFALWDPLEFANGVVRGRLRLSGAARTSSLIVAGRADDARLVGLEMRLDAERQAISIHRHSEHVVSRLAQSQQSLARDTWVDFRLRVDAGRTQFWLGDAPGPVLVAETNHRQPGRFGVSTSGAAFALEDVTIEVSGRRYEVTDADASVKEKALASLALVVFNLNEFVYID